MSLFINTADAEKLIKYGFEYKKTGCNKYCKLEYTKYDDFDYVILKAEWIKGEKTALLEIEKENCIDWDYITLEIPDIIYDLINEGLITKNEGLITK